MIDLASIEYHHARQAVQKFDDFLLRDPNCWGVGVGAKHSGGAETDTIAVVVMVARKLPRNKVPMSALLPQVLDIGGGRLVPVDVVQAGPFYQQVNTARIRPAQPGTSLGNVRITAGTYGAMVVDTSTGKNVILSNNHVLADNNQAALGSDIVQPGPFDGGVAPADVIATLTRYIEIVPEKKGFNLVDAAIATPAKPADIGNVPLNNVPAPSAKHPGVGLLWGGDGVSRSNWSPLRTVLDLLKVQLPAGGETMAPAPGLSLQKTGRTTERTVGKVQEINATLRVTIPNLGDVVFKDQFTTTAMSEGGDSGSLGVTEKAQS